MNRESICFGELQPTEPPQHESEPKVASGRAHQPHFPRNVTNELCTNIDTVAKAKRHFERTIINVSVEKLNDGK